MKRLKRVSVEHGNVNMKVSATSLASYVYSYVAITFLPLNFSAIIVAISYKSN